MYLRECLASVTASFSFLPTSWPSRSLEEALLIPLSSPSIRSAHPVGSSTMILSGFGFISRMYGLSIDNIVEVEMVLADGRIVIVNKDFP